MTAGEIFATTKDLGWLRGRLPSIEAVAKHIQSQKHSNGLISGSGFYTEAPPRYAWDGVTQCYVIHAFRELAKLFAAAGNPTSQALWSGNADQLAKTFVATFWRDDHFGEYVHPERGLVDAHGLSDVNWAAIAFGIATDKKLDALWARLMKEPGFWHGDMPTQTVTKPFSYETWEHNEPVPIVFNPVNDVAAMGRAWYVEAVACQKMGAHQRLLDAALKVSRAGKADGHWRERYHPQADGSVKPSGAGKYCEYAAVLTRVVFGNRGVFCS